MKTVFADAYYFIALLNPRDAGHARAVALPGSWQRLVTTEWVLVETGNALSSPAFRNSFVRLVEALRRPTVEIVYSTPDRLDQGLALYEARSDKYWSLTDCLSFSVMQNYGIAEALTADAHFVQAGFVAVLI